MSVELSYFNDALKSFTKLEAFNLTLVKFGCYQAYESFHSDNKQEWMEKVKSFDSSLIPHDAVRHSVVVSVKSSTGSEDSSSGNYHNIISYVYPNTSQGPNKNRSSIDDKLEYRAWFFEYEGDQVLFNREYTSKPYPKINQERFDKVKVFMEKLNLTLEYKVEKLLYDEDAGIAMTSLDLDHIKEYPESILEELGNHTDDRFCNYFEKRFKNNDYDTLFLNMLREFGKFSIEMTEKCTFSKAQQTMINLIETKFHDRLMRSIEMNNLEDFTSTLFWYKHEVLSSY